MILEKMNAPNCQLPDIEGLKSDIPGFAMPAWWRPADVTAPNSFAGPVPVLAGPLIPGKNTISSAVLKLEVSLGKERLNLEDVHVPMRLYGKEGFELLEHMNRANPTKLGLHSARSGYWVQRCLAGNP